MFPRTIRNIFKRKETCIETIKPCRDISIVSFHEVTKGGLQALKFPVMITQEPGKIKQVRIIECAVPETFKTPETIIIEIQTKLMGRIVHSLHEFSCLL